jgi:hypothetical protein
VESKARNYLNLFSNIFTAGASIAALLICARVYMHSGPRQPIKPLRPGDHIGSIAGLKLDAPKTVLLAMSAKCHFCATSAPFYRRLNARRAEQHSSTSIIAVLPDTPEEASRFLQSANLDLPTLPGTPLDRLHVFATPTVLLVDRGGKVLDLWIGAATPQKEDQILAALSGR